MSYDDGLTYICLRCKYAKYYNKNEFNISPYLDAQQEFLRFIH